MPRRVLLVAAFLASLASTRADASPRATSRRVSSADAASARRDASAPPARTWSPPPVHHDLPDLPPRRRALPARGGETAPGSPDPIGVPWRQTPTFFPAFAAGYERPGPLAGEVAAVTLDAGLRAPRYGFSRVLGYFPPRPVPSPADDPSIALASVPLIAWGSGAHNTCAHGDNVELMTHLASWGVASLCPEVLPEPYPGDERVLFALLRFARDENADPGSVIHGRVRVDAMGVAGYSLGGGRVIRGLAVLQREAEEEAEREAGETKAAAPRGSTDEPLTFKNERDAARVRVRARAQEVDGSEKEVEGSGREVDGLGKRRDASRRRDAPSRRRRRLLGGGRGDAARGRCFEGGGGGGGFVGDSSAACVASLCRSAITIQGWNELGGNWWGSGIGGAGPGSAAVRAPLLALASADDPVAEPWENTKREVFDPALGPKLMGVVRGGGHNLGPHYWFGWTVAFLRATLVGDEDARRAAFGTSEGAAAADDDDEDARANATSSAPPFGGHPNVLRAWRAPGEGGETQAFDFEEEAPECPMPVPELSC